MIGVVLAVVALNMVGSDLGSVSLKPAQTITVTGEAKGDQANQKASFSAGVNATNADQKVATDEVKQKISAIITAVKAFGVEEKDIKTQNMSVYRMEDPITLEGRQKFQPGDWRVDNTIEITLRDVAKAADLTQVLSENGATNIYGPNLTVDDSQDMKQQLFGKAMENAKAKASALAKASNRSVGKVLSVHEGGAANGVYPMFDRAAMGMGGGGAGPVEPGSTTITQNVTVVFELK